MSSPDNGRYVLFIASAPVPSDRRIWQEAQTLAAAGYAVSVICPKGPDADAAQEMTDGVRFFRYPLPAAAPTLFTLPWHTLNRFVWVAMLAIQVFFTAGMDVIHLFTPLGNSLAIAGFFKIFFGKKIIFEPRILAPQLHAGGPLAGWSERNAVKASSLCILSADTVRETLATAYKIAPERIWIVPDGIRLEPLKAPSSGPSSAKGAQYLVCSAMTEDENSTALLLETIRILTQEKKRRDIHCVLTGTDSQPERWKKLAAVLGITQHITFAGATARNAHLKIIRQCTVCVETSQMDPIVDLSATARLLEYMACGKPVILFEGEEGRRIAADAALYAGAQDAEACAANIIALLDNTAQCRSLGESGRERVETQFTWAHSAPSLLAAYDSIFMKAAKR